MLATGESSSARDSTAMNHPLQVDGASTSAARRPDPAAPGVAGCSVLISDEHYKHSLGIVRHLGRLGAQVSLLAASRDSLACRSKYCRNVILSSSPVLDSLVQATLQVVRDRTFDLVIPVSFPMTLALARRRDQLLPYTHLQLADSAAIERAASKPRMLELAESIGVPVPKTILSTELHQHARKLSFPLVIKPQTESPGRAPLCYARDWRELESILSGESGTRPVDCAGPSLVQEFIPGCGCGFFATYQNGVCKRIFMHRRVREYPARGGVSSCAESFYDPKLEAYGRSMLDALRWHGVAMVEFRRDSGDGEYKLMEVNPKFWGSLDLALAAGADFPGDLCEMALGKRLRYSGRYRRNLRFHWPFSSSGELFHLWTRPGSFLDVASDFLNPAVKSNVWLSDFGPNLLEMRGLARQLLRRRGD